MEIAFHIIVVIVFSCRAINYVEKIEEGVDILVFLTLIFFAVWAWLHMCRIW